jgi:hypothetical protein
MMQFTDRASIKGFRKTADGYLAGEVLCARTGTQQYLARELGLTGDAVVTVYRPAEAVFAKDSLASYAGKPVTLNHPPEMVTADNWKEYAAGVVGSEIARDGEFVRVSIAMMDADTIAAVQDGTREISMGYTTPIEMIDGTAPDGTPYQAVQTGPIKINHLAIVQKARGGDKLRIGDGAYQWGASPLTVSDKGGQMADLRKIMVDGLQVETTDAGASAIEKLTKTIADMKYEMSEAEKKAADEKAAMEAEMAEKDAALAKAEAEKMDDAAIDARVATRADLITRARSVVADLDVAGLSDADIRKAAVVAKLGDAAVEGKSTAYIDARFDILTEAKADPLKETKLAPKPVADLDAIYADRNKALNDAWKKGAN